MAGVDLFATAFSGANAAYLADLYARWVEDSTSVDGSFTELFQALDEEAAAVRCDAAGASWAPRRFEIGAPDASAGKADAKAPGKQPVSADKPRDRSGPPPADSVPAPASTAGAPSAAAPSAAQVRAAADDSLRAMQLIRAYRVRGHLEARLDPLGLQIPKSHGDLDPATYGFGPEDLDRPIYLGRTMGNLLGTDTACVREILAAIRDTYCGPVGVESMHVQDPEQRAWIQARIESGGWRGRFSAEEKAEILGHLTEAEGFEAFCQKRYVGTKRFGLEGGEVAIAAMHAIIDQAARDDVRSITIGMPHRGRLNTLVNIVRKPFTAIFSEFAGASFKPDDVQGSGDVKYHLGTSTDVEIAGHNVHLSLQPNPSHLEAVDPVVVGKVRAAQDMAGDTQTRRSSMALLLHGDAAFAGQGLVYETMAMSQLIGYRTGGTVHLVVNNQIGFTTISAHAYSGMYCTDIAKAVQAPILHVNGDEPEAVVFCARLCAEFRQRFATDIVLDIVCYRRHGHNESDEPAFTQPTMYKAIRARQTTRTLYAERLAREGAVSADQARAMWDEFQARLDDASKASKAYRPNKADWLEGIWSGMKQPALDRTGGEEKTGIALEELLQVGRALSTLPADFEAHPKIARQLDGKREMFDSGGGIDWATGEALAFGSLMVEGHRVRLSGEDCQRGTFSQRHAVLIDQSNQNEYVPLNNIVPDQAAIEIYNSLLSEFGVLGFEYGYSLADPRTLVLWEAQFGDFANGAQSIIDEFLSSGEAKWGQLSNLVLLLPHGHEGQGPDHTSGRIERFLQLWAEGSMTIAMPSTPSNYFHLLRRHALDGIQRPLIVFTPKSMLRNKAAVSDVKDFTEVKFRSVLEEPIYEDGVGDRSTVSRILLTSGKIYYELAARKAKDNRDDVAIVRMEQLAPLPKHRLDETLDRYPNAREYFWVQEEPANQGAWPRFGLELPELLPDKLTGIRRISRRAMSAPSSGSSKVHAVEQQEIIDTAFS